MKTEKQTTAQIWTMPILLGLLSVVGLVVALMADGVADLVSWLALGVPTLIGCWFPFRRGGDRAAGKAAAEAEGESAALPGI